MSKESGKKERQVLHVYDSCLISYVNGYMVPYTSSDMSLLNKK